MKVYAGLTWILWSFYALIVTTASREDSSLSDKVEHKRNYRTSQDAIRLSPSYIRRPVEFVRGLQRTQSKFGLIQKRQGSCLVVLLPIAKIVSKRTVLHVTQDLGSFRRQHQPPTFVILVSPTVWNAQIRLVATNATLGSHMTRLQGIACVFA